MLLLESDEQIKEFLEKVVTRSGVLVVGAGNELRCDDGFGVYVARALQNLLTRYSGRRSLAVIDAGTALESYLDLMSSSEVMILLDVVEAPAPFSKVILLQKHEIPSYSDALSTHSIGLGTLLNLISGDVYVIGTRPACLDFKVGVSSPVAEVIQALIRVFIDVLIDHEYLSETLKNIRKSKYGGSPQHTHETSLTA
jgi:hydrogenase 3 maturation protease